VKRLVVLLVAAGCTAHPTGGAVAVPEVGTAAPEDAVVATIDGRPVRASEIAVQAAAAGTSARQALDALIDADLLAHEARRRGLDADPDAQQVAKQELVRRWLSTVYEREYTSANVPDKVVRDAYRASLNIYDHSEYVDVWHILIPTRGIPPEARPAARESAASIAEKARHVADEESFKALAPPGSRVEQIVTARDGWTEKSFSNAAHDLKKPGDTSGVIETTWGYHVIYLRRRIPERHVPFEAAAPEIRAGLEAKYRRASFVPRVAELATSHQIAIHPERIVP
jgi:peptidyl-prolyl cis-trans isomerase C